MWKPISQLTVADLTKTPVWEYSEKEENRMVRSTTLRELSEYRDGPIHIAAATFLLNNGCLLYGYCSPADGSGLDYTQPVIIGPNRQVPIWDEKLVTDVSQKQIAETLDFSISDVFPLKVTSLVAVDGAYYAEAIGNKTQVADEG